MKAYYQQTVAEVLEQVNGGPKPLTEEEIRARQKRWGPNALAEGRRKSLFRVFLEQFRDFLVMILIVAAIVSGFLGDLESMAVILLVITLNAVLGTVQTAKAERSLSGLKTLSGPEAKAIRGGAVTPLPTRELTVGDLVLLEAGDVVPADGRLLESHSLKVDESALTGESLGVEKQTEAIEGEVPLGDRTNFLYSGSFVTYGRGTYLVTNIGMDTEVGKIAGLLQSAGEQKTPLQRSLDQFGRRLSVIILALCALLFGVSVLRGENVGSAFLFAVALAVAAIPEALSSIVTIVLSFGTQKMAREHAIIRKLQAVEGLGSVSVICSDKTGTLTQNRMTVEHCYVAGRSIPAAELDLRQDGPRQLLVYSMLCNDASDTDGVDLGDPTETALLHLGRKLGLTAEMVRAQYPRLGEVPFDSDRKRMSTVHALPGGTRMVTKGAVDVLLQSTVAIQTEAGVRPLTLEDAEEIALQNLAFSREGLRVLAVAYRDVAEDFCPTAEEETDLTFLGLIAMMDPPREESQAAVEACQRAGIRPVMITGDHRITAAAIARRIGILPEDAEGTGACEGAEIDGLTDEELKEFVEGISVYARVSPEHKIRIVRAWQEKGNMVAMTGDGVNDAPALKQADVGVAMGVTGTEVSKDAADMVLTDDNFATIVKAVENGRNIYQNIQKSIQFLLSGNFGAILTVLAASVAGLPVPFAAVHLLFINLLTDSLPAIALGLEPHSTQVMEESPRPRDQSILTKSFLTSVGLEGLVIGAMTLIGFLIGYRGGDAVLASTYAFGTLCLSRLIHGFNCKSHEPVLLTRRLWNNRYLIGAFLLGAVLITLVLTVPVFQRVFQVVPLGPVQLLTVYLLALANLPVIQLLKWIRSRRK